MAHHSRRSPRRRLVLRALFILALFAAVYAALREPRVSGELSVDNPRFEQASSDLGDEAMPAVLRYVSARPAHRGEARFGLLVRAREGFPEQVLDLTALQPELGSTLREFLAGGGFELADALFTRRAWEMHPELVEELQREHLAERLLPPVDISVAEIEDQARFVIGVGFNYAAHREETDADADKFLFAKVVEPTGAYAPVSLGPANSAATGPARLVDYEVELGFVLLEDMDLAELPEDPADLLRKIAFVAANDVSNRWPIVLQGDAGFTRGKSRPTYLPLGPWMVHGRHLHIQTRTGGKIPLSLRLWVDETRRGTGGPWRQDSSTANLIRGPLEILRMAAEIHPESRRPDVFDKLHGIAREQDGRFVIPAGSLILTGTPAGTAIEAPTTWDKIRLLARANLSVPTARRLWAEHCIRHRHEMGFLSVGDTVDTHIPPLGRQHWPVTP